MSFFFQDLYWPSFVETEFQRRLKRRTATRTFGSSPTPGMSGPDSRWATHPVWKVSLNLSEIEMDEEMSTFGFNTTLHNELEYTFSKIFLNVS